MVLVDSSIWIDHFRYGLAPLEALLEQGSVLTHPFIIGELACGCLKRRAETLELLEFLPSSPEVTYAECMTFVTKNKLFGRGIGWVDVNLLASALVGGAQLWTRDKRLAEAAKLLKVAWEHH